MKNPASQPSAMNPRQNKDERSSVTRREFLGRASAAAAFTIVPRHVLGGAGHTAPSEKITVAYIGCGTQGLREMLRMLATPEVQVVAVCDPVKEGNNYVDFSRDGLRAAIAESLGQPAWRKSQGGIPGGREVGREIVERSYAAGREREEFKGCTAYSDFRELLAQEKDVDAVKIMTPDHLHATIAIAAMRQGKHTLLHKPLANRLHEARLVIDTARRKEVATHFLPANNGSLIAPIKAAIDSGAIGKLREIHNWSNRPVWPQYATLPKDRPAVPEGFDWQLWLGPSLDRPYHPNYTHAVFRGWYEFGGGALADMGHYSLWSVFTLFDLDSPLWVESRPSHLCTLDGNLSTPIRNDFSFPSACTIRFRFAAKGDRPALDLTWYDGGMKPPTPEELEAENKELTAEGMMFVGERGSIIAGFRGESPRLLTGGKAVEIGKADNRSGESERGGRETVWLSAFKGGKRTYGDFTLAGPISDAVTLAGVSLRLGGKRVVFDAKTAMITNVPEANRYLTREYRKGWELSRENT